MSNRRAFLQNVTIAGLTLSAHQPATPQTAPQITNDGLADRRYWLNLLHKLAQPVLSNLAAGKLKARMPVEAHPKSTDRPQFTHLEALGRLLTGIAPWLELNTLTSAEEKSRKELAALTRQAIHSATHPASPDFLNFNQGQQPLVDAAFLAHALLRAPNELWRKLDTTTQKQLVNALKSSRRIRPGFNNWLLFAAMVEATLCRLGEDWDAMRVDYAVRQHEQWYKGDGLYGDGAEFHWDYYNSFVIHPMLLDVLESARDARYNWNGFKANALKRAQRYAAIQERLISPEGAFPAIGRSLAYRFGAFQLLGQMALRQQLPVEIKPAQVRCALTAVIQRMTEAPGTFDKDGWLTIGFSGHQPNVGETYISTGSLYLCAAGLLPLGLPPDNAFWADAPAAWSSQQIWSGQNVTADHAI